MLAHYIEGGEDKANSEITFVMKILKEIDGKFMISLYFFIGLFTIKLEECAMSVLIRRFKLPTGMMKEERIDDPDRIERYMQFFDREEQAKLEAGQKVFLDKDEWQFVDN